MPACLPENDSINFHYRPAFVSGDLDFILIIVGNFWATDQTWTKMVWRSKSWKVIAKEDGVTYFTERKEDIVVCKYNVDIFWKTL